MRVNFNNDLDKRSGEAGIDVFMPSCSGVGYFALSNITGGGDGDGPFFENVYSMPANAGSCCIRKKVK